VPSDRERTLGVPAARGQAVVRVGEQPPVAPVGVLQRQHIEDELAHYLAWLKPGQPPGCLVEHDDTAHFVGDHHPVRQLVREDQAANRNRSFG